MSLSATPRHRVLIAMVAVVSLIRPGPAHADSFLGLGGVFVGPGAAYDYLGVIGALGDLSSSAPVIRLWGDHLTYRFGSGSGRVDARSWGESASLGYQLAYPTGMLTGYIGLDSRDTTLSQPIVSPVTGTRTGVRLELDETQKLGAGLELRAIGSYVAATQDYWTRGQLVYALTDNIGLGPELVVQGNPEYSARSVGAMATARLPGLPVSVGLDVGYQQNLHVADGLYGAISLALTF